ncbi:CENP-S complex, centromere protein X [Metarhizium rileyi]|uniref:CENP-S complex, centromere protein X n=1 Tax=Metarhizium rileyi (strain RCEF 4871) TaxID=1649241 RepID=A0A167GA54_METRR|nr:CENP-S complex, centromere protein X [Metarhizium rileyi RCEF 4871]TWU78839.1 hypothetical protein ED733_007477 [Metarhizium rileyi]
MPTRGTSSRGRGRARGTTNRSQSIETASSEASDPFESSDDQAEGEEARAGDADDAPPPEKSVPRELLTRILHEFFTKDSTRISRDANAAVGKYMDIFVREAIARAAVEKNAGFLEVDDLEKIAPQLLLDL